MGPGDSEFEGGIYHGRIQLPSDYPFKPPSFMLLTPSGRFEIQKKICLSISNYHPEHWQPSWSVRTALVALIAFMPTNPGGALGSLDYKKEDRRSLAIKSRETPPKFGSPERQRVIDEIHEQMLSKAPAVPQLLTNGSDEETNKLTPPDVSGEHAGNAAEGVNTSGSNSGSNSGSANTELPKPDSESEVAENIVEAQSDVITRDSGPRVVAAPQNPVVTIQKPKHDRLLTLAAFGLTLAIMALVIKKFFKINGLAGYIEGKF
jgi:ubiquitin-conjugating enzyme E2 J1